MKYITSAIMGVVLVVVLTFTLTPLINNLYVSLNNLEPGPDAESKLFDLLIFVQWPIYFVVGVLSGWFLYTKYLTKSSSGR